MKNVNFSVDDIFAERKERTGKTWKELFFLGLEVAERKCKGDKSGDSKENKA